MNIFDDIESGVPWPRICSLRVVKKVELTLRFFDSAQLMSGGVFPAIGHLSSLYRMNSGGGYRRLNRLSEQASTGRSCYAHAVLPGVLEGGRPVIL